MAIKVKAAKTPKDLDEVFKLRYEVFIEQDEWLPPREDKRFVDRFDAFNTSVNFMVFVDDVLVGTVRLTKDSEVGISADDYYDFRQHILDENTNLVGIGRLCIKDKYRGSLPILNSLMKMSFYWAISNHATHLVIPLNPSLEHLMHRCGFQRVAEPTKNEATLHDILPMMVDLQYVKARDIFIHFVEKQNIVFFMENFYRTYYSAGETILLQDELGDDAFFIVEGRVKVTIGDINQPSQQKTINYIGEGEIFGEIALLCSDKRTANIIAVENTQVMVLEREGFLNQIKKDPEKLQFILDLLGKRFLNIVKHLK